MAVLSVHFDDFKRLCKHKRVYYYEGENYYDFQFLSDGFIVKSTIPKSVIEDTERFFADEMFYGSMRLTFRVPDNHQNLLEDVNAIKVSVAPPEDEVKSSADEETELRDIQRDGVNEHDLY